MEAPSELVAQPDVVMLDFAAGSREAAMRGLHAKLGRQPAVKDPELFLRDLLERVMLAGVCIAPEVALPHARTAAVERIVLGVARLAAPGVGFDGEHPGVRLMFMIGTPREQVEPYLRVVAAISRLLRTAGVREGLLTAKTEAEFRAWLAAGATK